MDDDGKQWKRLYDSLAEQVTRLEHALVQKVAEIEVMKRNNENAQRAVDVNKTIMKNGLTEFNRKEQEYIEVINQMKSKLKELGYADFDRLGNQGN